MASILRVNTLTDASSNNSIAMSFVAGGSAKGLVNIQTDGTANFRDSFNTSSLVDNGTGDMSYSFTNSFSNVNHISSGIINDDLAGNYGRIVNAGHALSASSFRLLISISNSSLSDAQSAQVATHGDLA